MQREKREKRRGTEEKEIIKMMEESTKGARPAPCRPAETPCCSPTRWEAHWREETYRRTTPPSPRNSLCAGSWNHSYLQAKKSAQKLIFSVKLSHLMESLMGLGNISSWFDNTWLNAFSLRPKTAFSVLLQSRRKYQKMEILAYLIPFHHCTWI